MRAGTVGCKGEPVRLPPGVFHRSGIVRAESPKKMRRDGRLRQFKSKGEGCLKRIDGFLRRAVLLAMLLVQAGRAKEWSPPAGGEQIPLWPDKATIARPEVKGEESTQQSKTLVAGRPSTIVENVVRPTMTVFAAKGTRTGAAIVVFPGGGYHNLWIDIEGTEVCDWITAKGVTCVVLKYRVPGGGPYGLTMPRVPMALQDAQRAIGLLRERGGEWGIDPHKIGVLGFSAGGHLVAWVSNEAKRRYLPVDAADKQSSRPDFAVVLYPGHIWDYEDNHYEKPANGLRISKDAPPTFILQAQDDPVDNIHESATYYLALLKAEVPVEMHVYAHGGHAFGLRRTDQPITRWPELLESWLRTIDMLPKAP
jgi:acetyl esterase/lipase